MEKETHRPIRDASGAQHASSVPTFSPLQVDPGPRWSLDVETFVRHGDDAYAVDMGEGAMAMRETR